MGKIQKRRHEFLPITFRFQDWDNDRDFPFTKSLKNRCYAAFPMSLPINAGSWNRLDLTLRSG